MKNIILIVSLFLASCSNNETPQTIPTAQSPEIKKSAKVEEVELPVKEEQVSMEYLCQEFSNTYNKYQTEFGLKYRMDINSDGFVKIYTRNEHPERIDKFDIKDITIGDVYDYDVSSTLHYYSFCFKCRDDKKCLLQNIPEYNSNSDMKQNCYSFLTQSSAEDCHKKLNTLLEKIQQHN